MTAHSCMWQKLMTKVTSLSGTNCIMAICLLSYHSYKRSPLWSTEKLTNYNTGFYFDVLQIPELRRVIFNLLVVVHSRGCLWEEVHILCRHGQNATRVLLRFNAYCTSCVWPCLQRWHVSMHVSHINTRGRHSAQEMSGIWCKPKSTCVQFVDIF